MFMSAQRRSLATTEFLDAIKMAGVQTFQQIFGGLVQFLNKVIDVPVAVLVRFGVETETVEVPQLQFIDVVQGC